MGCASSNLNVKSNIDVIKEDIENVYQVNDDIDKIDDDFYYGNEDTFNFTTCRSVSTLKLIEKNSVKSGITYDQPLLGFVIKTFGHVKDIKAKVFLNVMHHNKVQSDTLIATPIVKIENKSKDTFYFLYSVIISTDILLMLLQDKEKRHINCLDLINRINYIYNDTLSVNYKIPNITNGYIGKYLRLFVISGNVDQKEDKIKSNNESNNESNNKNLKNIEKTIISEDIKMVFKKRRTSITNTNYENLNGFFYIYDAILTKWIRYFYDLNDGILTYFCGILSKRTTIVGIIDLFGCTVHTKHNKISTQFIINKDKDHISPEQLNAHLYYHAGQNLLIEIIDDVERYTFITNLNIHIVTRNETYSNELVSNYNKHENFEAIINNAMEPLIEKEEVRKNSIVDSNTHIENSQIDDNKDLQEERKNSVEISKAPLVFVKKRESITISNLTIRDNVTGFFYLHDSNLSRWIKYYFTLIDGFITYYKNETSQLIVGIIDLFGCIIEANYKNISTQFSINKKSNRVIVKDEQDKALENQKKSELHLLTGNNVIIEIIDDIEREKLIRNMNIHIVFRKYC